MAAPDDFSSRYSDKSFWKKVKRFGSAAGKEVLSKALLLYYCYSDPATPKWIKGIIIGALGYFISPLDAIPDAIPVAGFADDLGALAAAAAFVAVHVKKTHSEAAKKKLGEWFD
jgi:uncharacterized membrane protein YkvA (DUF1232 family)